jgi:hypothetical protein
MPGHAAHMPQPPQPPSHQVGLERADALLACPGMPTTLSKLKPAVRCRSPPGFPFRFIWVLSWNYIHMEPERQLVPGLSSLIHAGAPRWGGRLRC